MEDLGTGLVLYAGPPGEMRIHWRLARDDFERAASSFPLNGRRPAMVVRLRRDRPQGGTDQADELALGLGVRDGSGERAVRIPTDHCRYHAELGLTNADGGWLMLARSNGLYNAVGIGLDLEALPRAQVEGAPREGPTAGEGVGAATPASPGPGFRPPQAGPTVEPALGVGGLTPLAGAFPVVDPGPSPLTSRVLAGVTPTGGLGPSTEAVGPGAALTSPDAGSGGASRQDDGLGSVSAPPGASLLAGGPQAPGMPPSAGAVAARIGVALAPLTYESPPEQAAGLELNAELRISGRAPPGSTLDLFGFRYRVGSGGRFQLLLPVTDPEVLRRALEAAPPAELTRPRDD